MNSVHEKTTRIRMLCPTPSVRIDREWQTECPVSNAVFSVRGTAGMKFVMGEMGDYPNRFIAADNECEVAAKFVKFTGGESVTFTAIRLWVRQKTGAKRLKLDHKPYLDLKVHRNDDGTQRFEFSTYLGREAKFDVSELRLYEAVFSTLAIKVREAVTHEEKSDDKAK